MALADGKVIKAKAGWPHNDEDLSERTLRKKWERRGYSLHLKGGEPPAQKRSHGCARRRREGLVEQVKGRPGPGSE